MRTILMCLLLAGAVCAQSVEWVAFSLVAPGSTAATSYYAVTVPSVAPPGQNIKVERVSFTFSTFNINRVIGAPVPGSSGLWCLGAADVRVVFLARVAPGQVVETLSGVPRWQTVGACGLAVPMPPDTLGVYAVVVSGLANTPP